MSHSPISMSAGSLAAMTLVFHVVVAAVQAQQPVVSAAQAQSQSRIQGVVVRESNFQPIADATVSIVGTDLSTETGPMGEFALPDAPLGVVWVRVESDGLPSIREQVQITEGGVIFLQFRMPANVIAFLDEVLVDVRSRGVHTSDAQNALDLVAARVPGIGMSRSGDIGDNDQAVRLRGVSSLTQSTTPIIVVDDVVLSGSVPPLESLSQIPASDVASIEVLRGPAAAFRYPYAANGVIHVRTRKD